jgi:hypothetical protein
MASARGISERILNVLSIGAMHECIVAADDRKNWRTRKTSRVLRRKRKRKKKNLLKDKPLQTLY